MNIAVAAIVGIADSATMTRCEHDQIRVISLVEEFGEELAFSEPKRCIERATAALLTELST
jgi:hypothetical protein